ncbi:MAG: tetratricopeptide repeat protein [Thiohalomonadales bacterium]
MNSFFSPFVIILSTLLYACGTMTAPGTAVHSSETSASSLSEGGNIVNKSPKRESVNATNVQVSKSGDDGKMEATTATSGAVENKQIDQHTRILAAINVTKKNTSKKSTTQKNAKADFSVNVPKSTTSSISAVDTAVAGVNIEPLVSQTHTDKVLVSNTKKGLLQPATLGKKQKPKGGNKKQIDVDKKIQITEIDTKSREESIKYSLANRYYQSGKYQSTIDILETSNGSDIKKSKNRDLLVLAYTAYAKELVSKADLLEAQTLLEKAILMQPANKIIQRQLSDIKNVRAGNLLYKKAIDAYNGGNQEKAFESFHRVLILNPSHKKAKKYYIEIKTIVVDAHHKKALQYYRRQKLAQAIKEWDSLLKVDPGNEMARIYRSRAIELQKKFEKL